MSILGRKTCLQVVSSLRLPSSSSEGCLLGFREWLLDAGREGAGDVSRELCLDKALRETVFLLSKTCLRRSGMVMPVRRGTTQIKRYTL